MGAPGVALVPAPAFAHAALVKSAPGGREVLSRMPGRITLCFNEKVELKFSSVRIGKVNDAPTALDPLSQDTDPKCLSAAVPPALSSGDTAAGAAIYYAVHYRVLSLDGHVIEASYQFTVRPEAATP